MVGKKKIVLAGNWDNRWMGDSEPKPPQGDPRLHQARPQPITEEKFEWSRKLRRMAC
jgi:hypothetical protein